MAASKWPKFSNFEKIELHLQRHWSQITKKINQIWQLWCREIMWAALNWISATSSMAELSCAALKLKILNFWISAAGFWQLVAPLWIFKKIFFLLLQLLNKLIQLLRPNSLQNYIRFSSYWQKSAIFDPKSEKNGRKWKWSAILAKMAETTPKGDVRCTAMVGMSVPNFVQIPFVVSEKSCSTPFCPFLKKLSY